MTTAIPFFGDTIAICSMVWTVVSDYQDAPEHFKNFSTLVRLVGSTLRRLENKARETTFFEDLDGDSKIVLKDQLNELHKALEPMREIQEDYQEILDKRKKDEKNAQSGLRASLRGTLGGSPSPQPPEKREDFVRRKWKQTKFSRFKMDIIAFLQTNLDRNLQSLDLFVGFENLGINVEDGKMIREIHSKIESLSAPQPTPRTTASIPTKINIRPRKKISCLFVDDTNTGDSIIAQAYAELVKLWTLDNLAASPFGALSSAGLHVRSSLITPSLLPSADLSLPGQSPLRSAIATLFPGTPEADEMCTARFVGSLCTEVRRVKARTYAHVSRGICVEDFIKFDLIVACNEDVFLELEALSDIVTQMAASKPGQRLPSAKLRLLRMPKLDVRENVEDRMVRFARDETSWWECPRRKMGMRQETKCAFRTMQAVVAMGSEELVRKVGSVEGVFVFVEPIDGRDGEESLLTVTGKYGKMDSTFKNLEKKIPMRKS